MHTRLHPLVFGIVLAVVVFGRLDRPLVWAKDEKGAPSKKDSKGESAEAVMEGMADGPGVDYICDMDVFYTWEKALPPEQSANNGAAPMRKQEPIDTFYTTVGEHGRIVEDVRNRLSAKLPTIKAQALDYCKRRHEDLSSCVATRIKSNASEYERMDFASRRAFLTAVSSDCATQTGECMATATKPMRCYLNRPPEMGASEPDSAKEEEASDKKKKGK